MIAAKRSLRLKCSRIETLLWRSELSTCVPRQRFLCPQTPRVPSKHLQLTFHHSHLMLFSLTPSTAARPASAPCLSNQKISLGASRRRARRWRPEPSQLGETLVRPFGFGPRALFEIVSLLKGPLLGGWCGKPGESPDGKHVPSNDVEPCYLDGLTVKTSRAWQSPPWEQTYLWLSGSPGCEAKKGNHSF